MDLCALHQPMRSKRSPDQTRARLPPAGAFQRSLTLYIVTGSALAQMYPPPG